ncbi:hypothetical protein ACNPN6_06720 [Enterobacter quasiroggenkampii]|uniref:hypothetical protein n=1 Tax=Enterobacter quasiroggenkampii TaxID=2497436 RepID=UPI003AAD2114
MGIWFAELIVLLVGFLILLNGWIIPFIGIGFLGLCLAGQIYTAAQKLMKKRF